MLAPVVNAGNAELPLANDQVLAAPQTQNWQGFYAGAQVAFGQGQLESFANGTPFEDLFTEGAIYGAFAGYNVQRGNFVFGGELAYSLGEMAATDAFAHSLTTEDILDLKARAGFATGNFLLYGFGGWSTVKMLESVNAEPQQLSGLNYGVGVDVMINDRIIVGVDYTIRDVDGDFDQAIFPNWTAAGPVSTVGLRAGIKF